MTYLEHTLEEELEQLFKSWTVECDQKCGTHVDENKLHVCSTAVDVLSLREIVEDEISGVIRDFELQRRTPEQQKSALNIASSRIKSRIITLLNASGVRCVGK